MAEQSMQGLQALAPMQSIPNMPSMQMQPSDIGLSDTSNMGGMQPMGSLQDTGMLSIGYDGQGGQSSQDVSDISIKDILHARTASRGKTTRRRKRGPKAATSAFAFFRAEVLGEICEHHPTATPEEAMAILEARWSMLPESEKQIYQSKAMEDDVRYHEELKLYLPKSQGGTMKRKKARKHPSAPKHPMSAYLYFVADNRQKLKSAFPEKGFTEIAKMLGDQWRKLDPATRQAYEQRASQDKERYKIEKDGFQPPPTEEPKKEERRRKKHPLAPKHPLSAYLFFVATNRPKMNAEHPEKDFTEVAQMLGNTWKSLPPHQRKKYDILAYADKKRYLEEKEKWTPPVDKKQKLDSKKVRTSNRAKTAYSLWAMNERAALATNHPDLDKREATKLIRDKWRVTSEEQKAAYMDAAAEKDKNQYDESGLVAEDPYRQANAQDANKRRGRPRKYQASNEVLSWNSLEIGRFIASLGLQEHKDKFVRSNITGEQFVKLTSPQLRDNFQIANIGDRKKIIKGIANLLK